MKKFQEIEQLSAYLDGQLNKADSAKLEARIKSDPELASAISELRAARSILHKLPARKAPRNFTLTRQMVGLKPPLPRSYPLFRFATVFAAILFVFSFTATTLAPLVDISPMAAPAQGYGSGGGGDEAAMESAPAATEAPATEEPTASEEMLQQDTAPAGMAPADSARVIEGTPTPALKEAPAAPTVMNQVQELESQPTVTEEAQPSSFNWSYLFLALSILGGVTLWIMQASARNKWR